MFTPQDLRRGVVSLSSPNTLEEPTQARPRAFLRRSRPPICERHRGTRMLGTIRTGCKAHCSGPLDVQRPRQSGHEASKALGPSISRGPRTRTMSGNSSTKTVSQAPAPGVCVGFFRPARLYPRVSRLCPPWADVRRRQLWVQPAGVHVPTKRSPSNVCPNPFAARQ